MLHGAEIERFIALAYGISGGIMLLMLWTAIMGYRRARAVLRTLEQLKKQP